MKLILAFIGLCLFGIIAFYAAVNPVATGILCAIGAAIGALIPTPLRRPVLTEGSAVLGIACCICAGIPAQMAYANNIFTLAVSLGALAIGALIFAK